MRSPSNSKGTTMPCSWFTSSFMLCWVGIRLSSCWLGKLFLPSPTKDRPFSPFFPHFHPKGCRPNLLGADEVRIAYQAIETAVRDKVGAEHFLGVTVQPM